MRVKCTQKFYDYAHFNLCQITLILHDHSCYHEFLSEKMNCESSRIDLVAIEAYHLLMIRPGIYRMADNYRRVLIFVIFMVDLAVTNFPPTKINAYGIMVLATYIYESMVMGVATNIVAVQPTLSSVSKQQ